MSQHAEVTVLRWQFVVYSYRVSVSQSLFFAYSFLSELASEGKLPGEITYLHAEVNLRTSDVTRSVLIKQNDQVIR